MAPRSLRSAPGGTVRAPLRSLPCPAALRAGPSAPRRFGSGREEVPGSRPHRTAPHRVGRSAGARRLRAGLRQGRARELPWSSSDRGVGQSRAEGHWGGAGPRLSAVQLGQAGWKGAGCRRGKGLPPPPCSQSITGCDPAPLRRRAHRGMGWHGSPFQQCQAPLSSSAASFASRGGTNRKGSGEEAPTTFRAFVAGRAPR
ncbi:uncharacterized protein LOC121348962 [Pyrgilauda ruficollis]|uniref:uncharacterized protein LOC121348962 n=1 Tax=Pyrgilauda ruficollis TaxID=221976 RepID=UPI001B88248E|nr:uncharacterized protein LOC121348962 [Pyrgilauda ruficollis]